MLVKRLLLILAVLIFSISIAYATVHLYGYSADDFKIYGYMDGFVYFSIDGLSSSDNVYTGMPFDLMGNDVASVGDNSPLGRIIAYWSLMVNIANNSQWRLGIQAEPLKYENNNEYQVNYHLTFYTNEGGSQILVQSDSQLHEFSGSVLSDDGSFKTIIDHRQVRIMLASDVILDNVPEGNYRANVKFVLEGQ